MTVDACIILAVHAELFDELLSQDINFEICLGKLT